LEESTSLLASPHEVKCADVRRIYSHVTAVNADYLTNNTMYL